jgi:hypothetical protein
MNLSYKDVQFIIEALDYRIKSYQEVLEVLEDEDQISDISNDCYFLENLRQDLTQRLNETSLPKVKL